MSLKTEFEQIIEEWTLMSPSMKVITCVMAATSTLSIGSLSSSIIEFRGFVAVAIDMYVSLTMPIRLLLGNFAVHLDTMILIWISLSAVVKVSIKADTASADTALLTRFFKWNQKKSSFLFFSSVLLALSIILIIAADVFLMWVTGRAQHPAMYFVCLIALSPLIFTRQEVPRFIAAITFPFLLFAVFAAISHGLSAPLAAR